MQEGSFDKVISNKTKLKTFLKCMSGYNKKKMHTQYVSAIHTDLSVMHSDPNSLVWIDSTCLF